MAEPRPDIDPAGTPTPGEPRTEAAPASRRRPWWRRVLLVLGGLVTLVLLVVIGFIIYIQTEWGRSWVEGMVLEQIQNLLAEDATVTADRIDGNFLTGARVLGLELAQAGETSVHADTAWINYNLLTLLRRRFSADELYVSGLGVYARQRADSTWNLAHLFAPTDPDPDQPADTTGGFTVAIGEARLHNAFAEVHFLHPQGDSILYVRDLAADFSTFTTGPEGPAVALDTLHAAVTPAAPRPEPLRLALRGALAGEQLRLDALALRSATTDLAGEVLLDWGGEQLAFGGNLRATPLDLADVRALVPVPLYGTHALTVETEGTTEELIAHLVAEFEGGGRADLDLSTSMGEGPVHYAAAGTLTAFNPQSLLGEAVPAADLSATLDVDLRGTSLDEIGGSFEFDVRDSRVGDRQIQQARVNGTVTEGRFQFEGAAALSGLRASLRGTARPFAEVPTYDVRGDIGELNLATVLRNPEQQGRFSGTVALEGRGFDPETAVATAAVQLRQGQYGEIVLDRAELAARLNRGTVAYDLEAVVRGGGFAAARGTVQPFAEPLAYVVEEGRVVNFDLAAVTGDTTHTDLTGTFSLRGRGTPPEGALAVTANLQDSRYGEYRVAAASLSAQLQGGTLEFDVTADLAEAGQIAAVGTARPFAEPITYSARGRVDNLDLAALTGNPSQSSDLTGAFEVAGTGIDPQTLTADLRLDLEPSRYRQQEFLAGTVTGQLRAGALDLGVEARTPEGTVAFAVRGRPFDEVPTLALSEGTFRGVNLALLLDNPALQTDLNGRIDLDANGFDPQFSQIEARITLLPSRINNAEIAGGTVVLDLDRGYVEAEASLDLEQGRAAVAFSGRPFDETPTYDLSGDLDRVNFAALLGDPNASGRGGEPTRLSLAFDVSGQGLDPETMTLQGRLRGGDSVLPGGTLDSLRADFALADGLLRVDALHLRSSVADASGRGHLALFDTTAATDFTFTAEVKDTEPLDAFLPQPLALENGTLGGRAYGMPGQPLRFDVEASGDRVAYGDIRASRLNVEFNGEYRPEADSLLDAVRGKARLRWEYLALPTFALESGDVTAEYDGTNLAARGAVGLDERRDLTFRARTEFADTTRAIALEAFDFAVDDERWTLLREARIFYGDRYRIRNLLLYADDQQIAIDGVLDLDGTQNLVVTIENVQLDRFVDFVGYEGVGGELTATLVLSGPATAPVIDGSLAVEDVTSGGEPVGALDIDIAYDDFRLTLDALLTHVSGRELRAEGYLPLAFQLAQDSVRVGEAAPSSDVRFTVAADSFPIAWVEPFLPPGTLSEIGGTLNADIRVTGTQADPVLEGDALLADGRLGLPALGRTYQNAQVPITFEANRAVITGARVGTEGNGELRADGTIRLPKLSLGELDLNIGADRFRVISTRTYDDLRISTNALRITGTTQAPVLEGALTLASGDIHLTEELTGPAVEEVVLTPMQIQELEATFGTRITEADTAASRLYQNLSLDLTVEIERNVWLRSRTNPVMDIEFTGSLLAQKQPGGDIQLFRSIEVVRGRVEYFGRAFTIETGQLTFNGPISETLIDIQAAFRVPARDGPGTEATIYLTFAGRLGAEGEVDSEDGLQLTLSSDPAMENTDIVSYIATGRPAGEAFQGGGTYGTLAVSQLGSVIEGLAANSLGLDVVEVEQRPGGSIVVTFGAYVTNRTFASVSQVVTQGSTRRAEEESRLPEITVEYEVLNWLLLRLENRNIGGVGGSAQIEFAY